MRNGVKLALQNGCVQCRQWQDFTVGSGRLERTPIYLNSSLLILAQIYLIICTIIKPNSIENNKILFIDLKTRYKLHTTISFSHSLQKPKNILEPQFVAGLCLFQL